MSPSMTLALPKLGCRTCAWVLQGEYCPRTSLCVLHSGTACRPLCLNLILHVALVSCFPDKDFDPCRYDGLVGQFSAKQIPSVGMSVGIERVFAVLEGKFKKQAEQCSASIRETRTQVACCPGFSSVFSKAFRRLCSQAHLILPAET